MKNTLYVISLLLCLANAIGAAYNQNLHSVFGWLTAFFLQIHLMLYETQNEQ